MNATRKRIARTTLALLAIASLVRAADSRESLAAAVSTPEMDCKWVDTAPPVGKSKAGITAKKPVAKKPVVKQVVKQKAPARKIVKAPPKKRVASFARPGKLVCTPKAAVVGQSKAGISVAPLLAPVATAAAKTGGGWLWMAGAGAVAGGTAGGVALSTNDDGPPALSPVE